MDADHCGANAATLVDLIAANVFVNLSQHAYSDDDGEIFLFFWRRSETIIDYVVISRDEHDKKLIQIWYKDI